MKLRYPEAFLSKDEGITSGVPLWFALLGVDLDGVADWETVLDFVMLV